VIDAATWDAAAVAAKSIAYAGTFGAAGGVFFLRLQYALTRHEERVDIRRLVLFGAIAGLLASAASVPLTAGSMRGDLAGMFDPALAAMVVQGRAGMALLLRAAGLALALLALRAGRPPAAAAVTGALIAATSFAWVGHTHAAPASPTFLAPVTFAAPLVAAAHLLAVAFWLGALGPLLIVARRGDPRRVGAAAARFGKLAVYVVGVLVAAGAVLLWVLVGSVSVLASSSYGRSLSLKLVLVACLLGFAAANKLALTPRLRTQQPGALRALRRSIRCEIALAVVILLVTATFTTVSGPPGLE
jgi:putative copper resistance protein D